MNNSSNKVLILTAGLGDEGFVRAAERLERQLMTFEPNLRILTLNHSNLHELCPETHKKYLKVLKSNIKGYGYYAWKSELVHRAINGDFGDYRTVVWIDAGCEINSNTFSKIIFRYWLSVAKRRGYVLFSLRTPEYFYTKKDLISKFPNLGINDSGYQIQATYFMLDSKLGKTLSANWFNLSMEDINNINDEISTGGENCGFVEHRNDQSIISLCAKSLRMTKFIRPLPIGKGNGIHRIYSFLIPIWASRNRNI